MHAYYLLFCACIKLRYEENSDDTLERFGNKKSPELLQGLW